MNPNDVKICVAIICLSGLEAVAICKGKNGTILRLVIIAIAGLAGFSLAELLRHA